VVEDELGIEAGVASTTPDVPKLSVEEPESGVANPGLGMESTTVPVGTKEQFATARAKCFVGIQPHTKPPLDIVCKDAPKSLGRFTRDSVPQSTETVVASPETPSARMHQRLVASPLAGRLRFWVDAAETPAKASPETRRFADCKSPALLAGCCRDAGEGCVSRLCQNGYGAIGIYIYIYIYMCVYMYV
jgi:hypothetical protein